MGQEIIDAYFDSEKIKITAGGDTRFQSVKKWVTIDSG
jgi:2-C-methyl-D-erythritol 4-phosphate cytidylyltransferase